MKRNPVSQKMLSPSRWFLTALLAGGLVWVVGCSTETKQRWLSRFFDGVPDPNAPKVTNAAPVRLDEDGRPLAEGKFQSGTNFAKVKAAFFCFHPPYEEKKCSECHESRYSVKMKGTQRKVCFECHDDFFEKAKYKHQPAENSECSACHDPHGSAFPKMVKKTGKAGCLDCHDDFTENVKVVHTPAASGECLACHAPHASTNKFLVRLPGKKMCFECHDDFLAGAKFEHSVATDCSSCHNSHKSNEPGLLTKTRAQLCLECHEKPDMEKIAGHADMGNTACLTCHDPHVGKDKFLLKPAALAKKAGTKP